MKRVGIAGAKRKVISLVKEKRQHDRTECAKVTFFATQDRLYEGYVKNISLGGVYIESKDAFSLGETITVAIPCRSNPLGQKLKAPFEDEDVKMKCAVVWHGSDGIGLRFVQPQ